MKGRGIAYGAITIVNAIASGKGAALGIGLRATASVEIVEGYPGLQVELQDPAVDDLLVKEAVKIVLQRFKIVEARVRVRVESEIPIARGLKSSSTVSNAVVLATLAALDEELGDEEAINLGVDASLAAGVTITGAFDDASASYLGGVVVTDNYGRKILRREEVDPRVKVILYIPGERLYTREVDRERLDKLAPFVEAVHRMALEGDYWQALFLNGLLYSIALGFRAEIALQALEAGALAAGLSGTGPSFAAIAPLHSVEEVCSAWKDLPGRVMVVEVNNRKAWGERVG